MENYGKQHYTQTANSLLLYNKWTLNIKMYYQEILNKLNVDKKKDNSGFYLYVIISES